MRGMVAVEKVQVRHLDSVFLGLVIQDRPLCPLPIKEEPLFLLFCCFMAQEGGKEKNIFVWSIHPPYRSWNPHPSVMPWPHCYIPGTALLGEQGAAGCCCMSDRVGGQTKMDLKLLLLVQEGKRLKQMGNRMANGAGTITGNSSCNRVSLEASCRVVMLLYSL